MYAYRHLQASEVGSYASHAANHDVPCLGTQRCPNSIGRGQWLHTQGNTVGIGYRVGLVSGGSRRRRHRRRFVIVAVLLFAAT